MRKVAKRIALLCFAILLTASVFAACDDGTNDEPTWTNGKLAGFELSHDEGQADNEDALDYNANLFYLNETRTDGADPGAMYVSPENIVNSYEKYQLSKKYFNPISGNYEWVDGWSTERFISEFGTLDEWQEAYGDYYYMIVTGGSGSNAQYNVGRYSMWRSKDLNNWDTCGPLKDGCVGINTDDSWTVGEHAWAPEFMYDKESGLWYIWSSMNSKNGYDNVNTYGPNHNSLPTSDWDGLIVSCYVSETPLGPYRIATTKDIIEHSAAKNENGEVVLGAQTQIIDITKTTLKPFNKSTAVIDVNEIHDRSGALIGYKGGDGKYYNLNGYEIAKINPVVNVAYYYPRMATDARKRSEFIEKYHITNVEGQENTDVDKCLWPLIDVNPMVDEHGNKYLYFSQHGGSLNPGNHVWVVAMKDWLTPDWDTMTHVASPGAAYITQDGSFGGVIDHFTDFNDSGDKFDANGNQMHSYDTEEDGVVSVSGGVNEGTEVIYHDGRFYLTYSPFGYGAREYSPYIAVSTDPLGREDPFVKLGTDYSPIIGIGVEDNDYMSGTGHHCFIQAGDELFILYHCFWNPISNTSQNGGFLGRCIGVDRAYWKYVPELGYDILFGNGPSYNLQPKPETFTGYTNVGKFATVVGNGDFGDVSYLTDGMVTAQPFSRQFEYGKTDGGLEIQYKWDEPVKIKALMVYNAGGAYEAFKSVTSVVFKLAEKPSWYSHSEYNGYCYISGINCDENDYNSEFSVMRKASAAIAEFDEIAITEMYVYISGEADNKYKTEYQSTYGENKEVHVSEIYIFGNKA